MTPLPYALAKELKDAGLQWQESHSDCAKCISGEPSLDELIEACPANFETPLLGLCRFGVYRTGIDNDAEHGPNLRWFAGYFQNEGGRSQFFRAGSTPKEAVARLWLELRKAGTI